MPHGNKKGTHLMNCVEYTFNRKQNYKTNMDTQVPVILV